MKRCKSLALALAVACLPVIGAEVGSDLVLTPAGYRARTSVHRVEPGRQVRGSGVSPELSDWAENLMVGPRGRWNPNWISYTGWTVPSGDTVVSFRSTWQVPPEPASRSGQIIFLFNGIENRRHSNILQPVLQWGSAADGGGEYWSIASWNVGSDGTYYTQPVRVKPGDLLVGVMERVNGGQGTFSYTSTFEGVDGTTLHVDDIDELVWLNETLEAYGISDCSDYPSGGVSFKAIAARTSSGAANLEWQLYNQVTDCGQHAVVTSSSATGGEVDIFFR